MSPEEYKTLEKALTDAVQAQVKVTVNGKIDKLTTIVNETSTVVNKHIAADTLWKSEDKTWKETAQPVITNGNKIIGFWSVIGWISGSVVGIAIIMGTVVGIIALFKK